MSHDRRASYAGLKHFTATALERVGLSHTDAQTAADILATTDAWGTFTHGTKLLYGYLRRLKAGGLRPRGCPHLAAEAPAWAIVDGDSALGLITSAFAMRTAIAKARTCGVAYVGVRNSCHFGAAAYYSWLAAQEGLLGISMANDIPSVAAPGSRGPVIGSNPISYAVPAGRYRAILLDMSVATVAGGKVYAARMRGESIPNTWLVGADGKPTTDPCGFPEVGALQPAAGHKGYGIALLIETLAGIVTGAATTCSVGNWMWDDGTKPTRHGAAFLAMDLNAMMPAGQFTRRVEALVEEIHNAPRADDAARLYVPGEMEWDRYDRALKEGIPLPSDVQASLEKAAAVVGLDRNTMLE
ncbi:MAG: Ldh family oxidoreductase [Verrucomicrobiota bacterium]|nr:Ldh family oxidoreductase [Verrucomicrobiota bacterium]